MNLCSTKVELLKNTSAVFLESNITKPHWFHSKYLNTYSRRESKCVFCVTCPLKPVSVDSSVLIWAQALALAMITDQNKQSICQSSQVWGLGLSQGLWSASLADGNMPKSWIRACWPHIFNKMRLLFDLSRITPATEHEHLVYFTKRVQI